MALSTADVEAFLTASKALPENRQLSWRKRSEHVRIARVAVELRAIEVGEVVLVVNVAHRRWWTFKLLYRNVELRRWDFLPNGPRRHRNPPGCPDDCPRPDRSLEHEHVWHEGLGVDCSRPLQGAAPADHAEAYARFCDVVSIDPKATYTAPTAGQQLQFP